MQKDYDLNQVDIIKKENKRVYTRFIDRIGEIERNLGASMNFNKDFTDNHKYNYLRDEIERKRKEAREATDGI